MIFSKIIIYNRRSNGVVRFLHLRRIRVDLREGAQYKCREIENKDMHECISIQN